MDKGKGTSFLLRDHSFSTFPKFSKKLLLPYPLILARTGAYQRVRSNSFSENFANMLNEWSVLHNISFIITMLHPSKRCFHHIETSKLIYIANQLCGFYIMGALALKTFKYLFILSAVLKNIVTMLWELVFLVWASSLKFSSARKLNSVPG